MDLLSHDSTVILLHEKGYNAKLTAPIRTVEGIVTPLKSEGITSFAIDRYAMASLSGTTEKPEQAFNESSDVRMIWLVIKYNMGKHHRIIIVL